MIEFNGHIDENGTPKIYHKKELDEWFKNNAGKDFRIKVERKRKKRSTPQNAFYWAVVVPMIKDRLNELGHEFNDDDTHDALKAKFNTVEIINKDEVSDEIVKSTTKLTTVEFMEYLDKVMRWASEFLGIVIPEPNSQTEIDYRG